VLRIKLFASSAPANSWQLMMYCHLRLPVAMSLPTEDLM